MEGFVDKKTKKQILCPECKKVTKEHGTVGEEFLIVCECGWNGFVLMP